jgi:predicted AlkP superfamily pyrophosphatase or phosphodiesterase
MMGTSTVFDGGKRQLAVLREKGGGEGAEGIAWGLSDSQSEYYRFPDYVNDLPDIDTYFPFADAADGTQDGKWRGNDIADLKMGFDTPARIPYQTEALQEVMTREGLGHHEGTDLMFINYKLIDEIGHLFTASSIEMADSLVAQDAALPPFIEFLDRQVGKGKWVLLITADHGHSADKEVSGGFPIKVQAVEDYMADQFPGPDGASVVARVRPGWSFVDLNGLDETDFSLDDLAKDFRGLTKAETSTKPEDVPPPQAKDEVLLTSFPGAWLPGMIEVATPS